jgi:hypothetical protein
MTTNNISIRLASQRNCHIGSTGAFRTTGNKMTFITAIALRKRHRGDCINTKVTRQRRYAFTPKLASAQDQISGKLPAARCHNIQRQLASGGFSNGNMRNAMACAMPLLAYHPTSNWISAQLAWAMRQLPCCLAPTALPMSLPSKYFAYC